MLAALNRRQRQNESKISIAKDRELMVADKSSEGKASQSYSRERLRKTTKCNKSFVARGILDNFEISLAVLLPNTTTAHTITYINYNFLALIRFFLMAITIYDYLPSLMLVPSVSSLIRSMGNNSKNNKIIITGDL